MTVGNGLFDGLFEVGYRFHASSCCSRRGICHSVVVLVVVLLLEVVVVLVVEVVLELVATIGI